MKVLTLFNSGFSAFGVIKFVICDRQLYGFLAVMLRFQG